MRRDRGFVLINALILVAALSAVAVYLLSRAEGSRTRLETAQAADALALGLDAVEALALTRLAADLQGESLDHLGEVWARPQSDLDLALGTAQIVLSDAQGRFNLNRLADPEDALARPALDRLVAALGLSPQIGTALAGFVRPGGPADTGPYAAASPPWVPRGGAATMLPQIAEIPGIDAGTYARLAPYLTALPGAHSLNVNTATPEVLAALLPGVRRARLDQALATRRSAPFASVQDFLDTIGGLPDTDPQTDPASQSIAATALGVTSSWFRLDAAVSLNDRRATRQVLIQRRGPTRPARIVWRLTAAP